MAFWGGSRLAVDVPSYGIVSPFDADRIDCNAYTLTMGDEYYVTPEPGSRLRDGHKRFLNKRGGLPSLSRRSGDSFVIPPGQFAFLLTEETVRVPAHLMGFISLKAGIKFKGLINVSGFHVDPGFEGKLIYSVFNASPSTIHISRGDPLFLLWIADVDGAVAKGYYKAPAFPQNEIPNHLIHGMGREVQSIQGMADRLSSLEFKANFAAAIAAAAAIICTIIAVVPDATFKNIIHFFSG